MKNNSLFLLLLLTLTAHAGLQREAVVSGTVAGFDGNKVTLVTEDGRQAVVPRDSISEKNLKMRAKVTAHLDLQKLKKR